MYNITIRIGFSKFEEEEDLFKTSLAGWSGLILSIGDTDVKFGLSSEGARFEDCEFLIRVKLNRSLRTSETMLSRWSGTLLSLWYTMHKCEAKHTAPVQTQLAHAVAGGPRLTASSASATDGRTLVSVCELPQLSVV
ncbi:hypothetical protein EVAR_61024_1 [Eumeta japonica]|uniref:Uncharacterized protein n=1 Tax=Eumeta variegata TaxID=151549 RepID=A0A4C1ZJJ5_EUMVA|nr:hypothetical protein EVAR_61024_1 [Eumeta japonica]